MIFLATGLIFWGIYALTGWAGVAIALGIGLLGIALCD